MLGVWISSLLGHEREYRRVTLEDFNKEKKEKTNMSWLSGLSAEFHRDELEALVLYREYKALIEKAKPIVVEIKSLRALVSKLDPKVGAEIDVLVTEAEGVIKKFSPEVKNAEEIVKNLIATSGFGTANFWRDLAKEIVTLVVPNASAGLNFVIEYAVQLITML